MTLQEAGLCYRAVSRMLEKRRAGILLHITSLPGPGGNGDLGKAAYQFIDFLNDTGVSVWQTLPLGIPHGDGSPYQCLSAHAGNPALIDLDWLQKKGWLNVLDTAEGAEIDGLTRKELLKHAYQDFLIFSKESDKRNFKQFCHEKSGWLDDFALFMALKHQFNQRGWFDWPEQFRDRKKTPLLEASFRLSVEIEEIKFEQYVFFCQWHELRKYAKQKGILLFGDIPIFVAYDSAEVWAHPEYFKLNDEKKMTVVAGVPPDYFSETGQRWGNPHYDWEYMQETGFQWWIERMQTQLELFDIVRIDHFRGLEAAWEIPAEEETAINGTWVKAPGEALLNTFKETFGSIPLVAEDLGVITPEVEALRDQFGLPGMKILQFAFDGGTDNPYLPHNHTENCVVYTGTHDNDTTLGWFESLPEDRKHYVYEYLGFPQMEMPYALVHAAFESIANLAVIPMQDVLGLGAADRMNIPGTTEGNWLWRFNWEQVTEEKSNRLAHMVDLYGRR